MDGGSVHDRLYRTQTRTLRERKMEETAVAPKAAGGDTINLKNKAAVVEKVAAHGLKIVTYKPGKREQKQDTGITARGYTRNKLGGFYTS